MSLCTYPASTLHLNGVGGQNTSHQDPSGKSYSVFDDIVGFFPPIFYIVVISFLQTELRLKDNKITASELFYSMQMWEGDYRCLVPYSHKNPKKWKTYEMHDYREAFNEKQLKKVDQFKYGSNVGLVWDLELLKNTTKSTKSVKNVWKKSYGFPYVALPYVTLPLANETEKLTNSTKCLEKCAHYVSSYDL